MMRQAEFRSALQEELGEQLYDLVGDQAFDRWINAGQRKLGSYLQKTAQVSWQDGDVEIDLPADFHHLDTFILTSGCLPSGDVWGGKYVFNSAAFLGEGGTATLRYYATRPAITGSSDSTLTDEGDEALISYALYRFFKRLASSRADYRMYATITQANGVDINELEGVSERHLQDFQDAAESLEPLRSTTFFAD